MTLIGYDESEQLIEEPSKIRVLVFKRAKYALPVQAQGGDRPGVVSAPLPPQYRGPIDRCKAAVSVLATIIVLKYCYHMTLYRLQERYWRLGRVWMARSTMCGWIQGCALALEPLYKLMIQEMFMHGYLGFDDTGVKMLNPKGGTTTTARFWSYSGLTLEAPYQIYDFRLDRSMEGPLKFLRGFKGKVIGDELSTNKGVVKRMGIELAGCWDHARR
jgi:transposase